MTPGLLTAHTATPFPQFRRLLPNSTRASPHPISIKSNFKTPRLFKVFSFNLPKSSQSPADQFQDNSNTEFKVEVKSPNVPLCFPPLQLSLSDQAFILLTFIACTTCVAFTGLVTAAVPALYAMGKAAIALSKLADTAREELPSTMAAVRLSGMEISDLTLELNDLSQEIADGVTKSAQAMQAAEAGIRQIGSLARNQTMSMIEERANLPIISLRPAVSAAAKKTSRAVGQATKTVISIISGGEISSENEGNKGVDKLET